MHDTPGRLKAPLVLVRAELHFLECGILSRKYCPTWSFRVARIGEDSTYAAATSFLRRNERVNACAYYRLVA